MNTVIRKKILYDTELAPWSAHLDIAQQLRQIAPFGMANPQPVFLAKRARRFVDAMITEASLRGSQWLRPSEWSGLDGWISYRRAADTGSCVDVLYELHIDRYKGGMASASTSNCSENGAGMNVHGDLVLDTVGDP